MIIPIPAASATPCKVAFSLSSPGAHTVSVAIFLDQWSPDFPPPNPVSHDVPQPKEHMMVRELIRLQPVTPSRWHGEAFLPPGWYEYLFLVDGEWTMDPEAHEVCPDGVGGFNAGRMVEPDDDAADRVDCLAADGDRSVVGRAM